MSFVCVGVVTKQSFAAHSIFTSQLQDGFGLNQASFVLACKSAATRLNKQPSKEKKTVFLFHLRSLSEVKAQGEHTTEEETDNQVTWHKHDTIHRWYDKNFK